MPRHRHDRDADQAHSGILEVFDIRVVDEPPPIRTALAPRACRWHLWHRWGIVRVDARTTYVGCAACGRLHPPTLFERPVP